MGNIIVEKINKDDVNEQLIQQLAKVLTFEEPENFTSCIKWWNEWFTDKIPGEKITIIAKEKNQVIGLTRFWKTPFCYNKWLIEGLEVIPPKRRSGVGKAIIKYGISLLNDVTDEKVYVHISNKNIPSIKLHESIGFKKISNGSINSFGDYREHIDEYLLD
ncbi:GNAT family N-acetyltransferase [Oceanirhabdus sp. W0125-5]|uniref:GNAT family N-acetyltransferase n=1 Tax=Oceanirhabdus sp. W0125-5 TaxID=2999116 RepID=UPI0022F311F3|nr:GNAT family N-acetyltransferase [Oceanirhabdus sp. W0125-5]WBW99312.1 GNAT family N-acetyltransferase [Oceanirhabdus sp. W0125-5]